MAARMSPILPTQGSVTTASPDSIPALSVEEITTFRSLLKNELKQVHERSESLPHDPPTEKHSALPPSSPSPLHDSERQSPTFTPWHHTPRLWTSLGTALYCLNFLAQLLYSTLFRLSYRYTLDPATPAWVFGVNVDFYFLFALLCLCSLQGAYAVDDVFAARGRERLFSSMGRLWVSVAISTSPWVLAGGTVLDAWVGKAAGGGGVMGAMAGVLFGGWWSG